MKKSPKSSPEVQERVVRMLLEDKGQYDSKWAALTGLRAGEISPQIIDLVPVDN